MFGNVEDGLSGYPVTTSKVSEARLTSTWLGAMAPQPRDKVAADETNSFIRGKMRESSFTRKILRPITVTDGDVERAIDHDLPVMRVEQEPDSYASWVTFRGTGDRKWVQGRLAEIRFGQITTPKYAKSKYELMTYKANPTKIISDNSVKDCAAQEDSYFMELAEAAVNLDPSNQLVNVSSVLSKDGIIDGLKSLFALKRPPGCLLMSQELAMDLGRMTADNVGDSFASRVWENGVAESESFKPFGVRTILTIKNDVVDPNDMWIFSDESHLGKFFLLEDTTMHMEMNGPEVEWFLYSCLGIGIIDSRAVIRVRFNRGL